MRSASIFLSYHSYMRFHKLVQKIQQGCKILVNEYFCSFSTGELTEDFFLCADCEILGLEVGFCTHVERSKWKFLSIWCKHCCRIGNQKKIWTWLPPSLCHILATYLFLEFPFANLFCRFLFSWWLVESTFSSQRWENRLYLVMWWLKSDNDNQRKAGENFLLFFVKWIWCVLGVNFPFLCSNFHRHVQVGPVEKVSFGNECFYPPDQGTRVFPSIKPT